jgi:3D (Asp-Asp-Asp) domain-containing protein
MIILANNCLMQVHAEEIWKITAYCACEKCCGKSDGITASGKKARYGMVACNWLKFGTKIRIEGLGVFEVQDRGAKSLFGTFKNPVRHVDVYLPSHAQALKFGVKYLQTEVIHESHARNRTY